MFNYFASKIYKMFKVVAKNMALPCLSKLIRTWFSDLYYSVLMFIEPLTSSNFYLFIYFFSLKAKKTPVIFALIKQ